MRGRLNHVTDAHDARVGLERADVLQKEAVEARRYQVERIGILVGGFEVSDELKRFGVVGEDSERKLLSNSQSSVMKCKSFLCFHRIAKVNLITR